MLKTPTRKRPCRICRRWFFANPRLKERQMTCGRAKCQRQWHKNKCAEWNQENSDYFKTNYLQKKIDSAVQCRGDPGVNPSGNYLIKVPVSRMNTGMPLEYVQEVIGVQLVIIHEYLAHLIDRRWHRKLYAHHPFDTGSADYP